MTEEQLLSELREMRSPHTDTIAAGLASGNMRMEQPTGRHVPAANLRDIYTVRRELLSERNTAYAQTLHRDISELCRRLADVVTHECEFVVISTSVAGESYVAFRDVTASGVLGCCHLLSGAGASSEEWEKL